MDELQRVVDMLAEKLGRSVAIDDPSLHLKAYSAHYGQVDEARLTSILTREVPKHIVRWVYLQGVLEATDPVRLPRNSDFGVEPRICLPIRRGDDLLGFLWLIDPAGDVTGEEVSLCRDAAESAAELMFRSQLLGDLRRGRERELLRDLLDDSVEVRRHAAAEMIETDLIAKDRSYRVIVLLAASKESERSDADALESALQEVRMHRSRRNVVTLGRPHHQVVLVSEGDPELTRSMITGLAHEIREAGQHALARETVVGVGDARPDLALILPSYNEAYYAARTAMVITSLRPVAEWSRLGIYQMLARFPVEEIRRDALPAELLKLLNRPDGPLLADTLETYLDLAGSAAKAAHTLHLHRVSLYGRLRRIEDLTGVDLSDGQQRLALHLGLKLARLAGLRWPPSTA